EGLTGEIAFALIDDVPNAEAAAWLGVTERDVLAGLPRAKRRRDWLAGRRAAKLAISRLTGGAAPTEIEVVAPAKRGPRLVLARGRSAIGVSISHAGAPAGALAWPPGAVPLGIDLEPLAPVSATVDGVAFTAEESAWAREPGAAEERAVRLWTAKEAVLKTA